MTKSIEALSFTGRNSTTCAILSFLENAVHTDPGVNLADNEEAADAITTMAEMFYELTRDDGFPREIVIELR